MNWIKVTEKLPEYNLIPTMDWVLVTSERIGTGEKWPIAFARWGGKKWEFFETNEYFVHCPVKSDYSAEMEFDEITHWMPLPDSPKDE